MNKKYDAKTYNPLKVKLNAYEQSIEDSMDISKLDRPTAAQQKKIKSTAAATLKALKDSRANVRMSGGDMMALRQKANEVGMPYQTLIAHVMHLYLADKLVSIDEVKKLLAAGILSASVRK